MSTGDRMAEAWGDHERESPEPAATGEPLDQTAETAATRPGPVVLEADSWDEAAAEGYQGRRRAVSPGRRRTRFWIAIMLALVGIGSAIAVPLLLSSSAPDGGVAAPAPTTPVATTTEPGLATSSAAASAPASAPPRVSGAANPASTSKPDQAAPPPPPPPPEPFAPVTYEAEAGAPTVTLGGSAWVWDYAGASGGKIVRNVGNWGSGSEPGTVQLNDLTIPADGAYDITIYFVHPDGEVNRTAQITVSGLEPVIVSFVGGSECCYTTTVRLDMPAGAYTVTITNLTGHAPAIDKVVISRG